MVSVCLPSEYPLATSTILLGFLLPWVWGISSPLLLTLDTGYLLTTTLPDLQRGMAPLGPPAPTQLPLLGPGVAPPSCRPCPWMRGGSSHRRPWPQTQGSSSQPFLRCGSLALSAAAPDLGRGVTPFGRCPLGMGSSRLLLLTSDVG